jgi:hypothetical protein
VAGLVWYALTPTWREVFNYADRIDAMQENKAAVELAAEYIT